MIVSVSWLSLGLRSWATPTDAEEPRHILYLYDSIMGESDQENDGDELYAVPLAHLGLPLDTLDVARNEPPTDMAKYRGIIAPTSAWNTSDRWCAWLAVQARAGRRLFVVEPMAPTSAPQVERDILPDDMLNAVFSPLGLHLVSTLTVERSEDIVRVKRLDGSWFGFEAPLHPADCHWYLKVEATSPAAVSALTLCWEDIPGTDAEALVMTPGGGFAIEEYLFKIDVQRDLRLWRVDPFRLFERVFDTVGLPRPEVNIVNGGRTYFSHVDGDGFNSLSYIVQGRICAKILCDEIYTNPTYGQLPVTLSVIGAEADEATTLCLPVTRLMARRLFNLPNVEASSHAYAHPMDWRTLEPCWPDLKIGDEPYTIDLRKETLGSLAIAAGLAPKNRPPRIILWSGNCNPDEATLRYVAEGGYQNMNGGDGR